MRVVVQRVKHASVTINGSVNGKINNGFLVLLGVQSTDSEQDVDYLVKKVTNLRIFSDENDKMNLSLKDVNGELLIVSQFTLYANCKEGNRPSFVEAAKPDVAIPLYEYFVYECRILLYLPTDHQISFQTSGYLFSAADYGESSVVSAGTDVLYLHDLPCIFHGSSLAV